jgi:hypothetical protein
VDYDGAVQVKEIERVAEAIDDLRRSLASVAQSQEALSADAASALLADSEFLESCSRAVDAGATDAIEEVWAKVQHLSRFFGGDYVSGDKASALSDLAYRFQQAMLDLVISVRSSGSGAPSEGEE